MISYEEACEEVGAHQIPGASGRQGSCKAGIEGFLWGVGSIYCRSYGPLGPHKPFPTAVVAGRAKTPFSYEKAYDNMTEQAPSALVAGPLNLPGVPGDRASVE